MSCGNIGRLVITSLCTGLFLFSLGCMKGGRFDRRDPDLGAEAPPQAGKPASGDGIKLKGANLLAQSLFQTLGPNKDLKPGGEGGKDTHLFDNYSQNFGNTDGLRFGEIYPDSPSAGYFLALAIIADNAARICQTELGNATPSGPRSLCRCNTAEDARAMLDRAVPSAGFSQGANQDLVKKFQERCQADYIGAVSSLVSSLAFAVRQ